jgi:tRNA A-37 threonylcarbamoyl transferase component Bud32
MPRTLLLVFAAALALAAAEPPVPINRFRIHPNSRIQVNALHGGTRDGLLWIGAKDGLYRFDGFHYHKIPGYPFPAATHLASTTADGSLWIGAPQGLVRLRKGEFQTQLSEPVLGLAASGNDVFVRTSTRLLRMPAAKGAGTTIEPPGQARLTATSDGELWYFREQDVYKLEKGARQARKVMTVTDGLPGPDRQVVPGANGVLWFSDGEYGFSTATGPVDRFRRDVLAGGPAGAQALLLGRDSHVWFLPRLAMRLDPFTTWMRLPPVPSGAPSRAGFEDAAGHLWADLPGLGLLEAIPDPTWERWGHNYFRGKSVVQVLRSAPSNELQVVTWRGGKGRRWRRNPAVPIRGWEPAGSDERDFDYVFSLPDGSLLATTGLLAMEHLGADGSVLQRIPHPQPESSLFREILQDPQGFIWVASDAGLYQLTGAPGSYSLHRAGLSDAATGRGVTDLELDAEGHLWAGGDNGLAWKDDSGQWQPIRTDHPVQGVRSFTFGGGAANQGAPDEIWVSYHVDARLARLHRTGYVWHVEDLTPDSGYPREQATFVKGDSRGWIWVGTENGVRVSDGVHTGPTDWLHLTGNNGLAGVYLNKYGFFEDRDQSIWLASAEGVTHVRPDPAWFAIPAHPIRITRIEAGGDGAIDFALQQRQQDLPSAFPRQLASLAIDFGTLEAAALREVPLLYRVDPLFAEWRPLPGGSLRLPHLPDQGYRLEVAYASPTAAPTAALTYSFRVGPLPLLPRLAPWAAGLLLLLGGAKLTWNQIWNQRLRYRAAKLVHRLSAGRRRSRSGAINPPLSSTTNEASDAIAVAGQVLANRYRVLRTLSEGGFSTVYEAIDLASNAPEPRVAVKIYDRRAADFAWVRNRFAHEVTALQMIDHPGIVPLLDSWVASNGTPCLVTPLLEGETLRRALGRTRIDNTRAAALITDIGEALQQIHLRGIVHRDIKPENILLVLTAHDHSREQPVLIDFGNAGLLGAGEVVGTTSLLSGSIHYMAPEQVMHHYAAASDLYSFGIVILEMLTGKHLSDLGGYLPSPRFQEAMTGALEQEGRPNPGLLAAELAAVFVPDPARRPGHVATWSQGFAALLRDG